MAVSRTTTSFCRLSTSCLATAFESGVTKPTQWEDSFSVSTGSGKMNRFRRPASLAYTCIMSRYDSTSSPPILNTLPSAASLPSTPTR